MLLLYFIIVQMSSAQAKNERLPYTLAKEA